MREYPDKSLLDRVCIDFCNVLGGHTTYIIVSGFVAIASGRTRATEDIDIIISRLSEEEFIKLHEDLLKGGFVNMQSDDPKEIYQSYLIDNLSVRYTYKDKPLPEMEIKFAKDELDEYQLMTRTKLELTGLDVWFGSINMNIAFKEEYLKTPKDFEDARHLRIVYEDLVDEKEINKIKRMIREKRLS